MKPEPEEAVKLLFSEAVAAVRRNARKVGWEKLQTTTLLSRIEGEIRELQRAIMNGNDERDILEECGDIATYVAFLA